MQNITFSNRHIISYILIKLLTAKLVNSRRLPNNSVQQAVQEISDKNYILTQFVHYSISNSNCLFQVHPEKRDSEARFSDRADRLIITTHDFNADNLLSDAVVNDAAHIINVYNSTTKDPVPHLITEQKRIQLYWQTNVHNSPRYTGAVGFRLLAYPSGFSSICVYLNLPQSLILTCQCNIPAAK